MNEVNLLPDKSWNDLEHKLELIEIYRVEGRKPRVGKQ